MASRARSIRRWLPAAAGAALLGAAATATPVARGSLSHGTRQAALTTVGSFDSSALGGTVHFLIHLPAGYADGQRRYPVVYFLHGLPAGPTAYRSFTWLGQALDRTGRPAILVVPQGTRSANGDPEYHDWGPGRNWETALAVELPAYIDRRYRTIRSRAGRAIIGVSAGGYGAAVLGLHHPGRFAAIESWSGYFRPTDPTGAKTLEVGTDADNAYANVHTLLSRLAPRLRSSGTFLAFYVGASDPTFVPDNKQLDQELRTAGIAHTFRIYPGGHSNTLWTAQASGWLAMALDHLAPATSG